MRSRTPVFLGAIVLLLAACHRAMPKDTLVVTQTPVLPAEGEESRTAMDVRYPAGSRVVLLIAPYRTADVRVLSQGFAAAGDPCASWDGQSIYFAGKRTAGDEWQIYRVPAHGGSAEQMTRMTGGAMDPAGAAHDELVFTSPVPMAGRMAASLEPTAQDRAVRASPAPGAIYGQLPDKPPVRFTFGSDDAVGATVLRDGRILFVMARPHDGARARRHLCLFAMNNDGTEVSAYAGQDDGVDFIRRPRELDDGRVGFVAAATSQSGAAEMAEGVQSAAPFVTRHPLFAFPTAPCRSIEPVPGGGVLACVDSRGFVGRSMAMHTAIYRVAVGATTLGAPIFDDPQWNSVEAAYVVARPRPAGHTSAVMSSAADGTMLCLNVNESSMRIAGSERATRLRVVAWTDIGPRELGSVPVEADGSVLVRLPARVPLGFDTLDASGHVLRHQPPFVWLEPGENRGCVGCHERRNHAPKNVRPLATERDPARLELANAAPGSTAIAP